jgi:hypothetical protein
MNHTINGPDQLDQLPEGSRIADSGMVATKFRGAWYYGETPWEPTQFPVELIHGH